MAAFLAVALVGMISFTVDHGYLLTEQAQLQRTADAAALASVQDLIRRPDGTQDLASTRATAVKYVRTNLEDPAFSVPDADIEIGRYDPTSIYSGVTLLNTGTFDTVRVTLRRDGTTNARRPLFFARVLGIQDAALTASSTAILQKAQALVPGAEILPFATPLDLWNSLEPGEQWTAYGDGKLKDANGADLPGNWGTLDIGDTGNSSADLNDQILDGLRQEDLQALHDDGRIAETTHIDSSTPTWIQGDTGLSSGLKQSVQLVHGHKKLIPIYDKMATPGGSHVDVHVIGWGVVTVIDSVWKGYVNTHVVVEKSHWFNGKLRPKGSLDSTAGYIDGAYTSPVLVQ